MSLFLEMLRFCHCYNCCWVGDEVLAEAADAEAGSERVHLEALVECYYSLRVEEVAVDEVELEAAAAVVAVVSEEQEVVADVVQAVHLW